MNEPGRGPAWYGWGADVYNTRFQPAVASGPILAQVPGLNLKWAFGFPNGTSSYGQPTVVSDRDFVGTDTGYVYSLDAKTECIYSSVLTRPECANAPTIAPITGQGDTRFAVYFGDVKANVYAVDAQTGT
jgi:polyvinyl alcohol dehydrogenase (cytochrome)